MNISEKDTGTEKGSVVLLKQLDRMCAILADDLKKIEEGRGGDDGINLQIMGKSNNEIAFTMLMTMLDKAPKIRDLGKETIAPETDGSTEDTKVKSIQDFALNKRKA